jgi:hypothetical protein
MRLSGISQDRLRVVARSLLIAAGLCTYLVTRDDIVWASVKNSPHARLLEHGAFAAAAALLGLSLILEVRSDSLATGSSQHTFASFLRAVGIGCLLPLPGFLLLVIGDVAISLLLPRMKRESPGKDLASTMALASQQPWQTVLTRHLGLFCAFLSMLVFSIVLIDRVADVLFALTAAISIGAGVLLPRRTR